MKPSIYNEFIDIKVWVAKRTKKNPDILPNVALFFGILLDILRIVASEIYLDRMTAPRHDAGERVPAKSIYGLGSRFSQMKEDNGAKMNRECLPVDHVGGLPLGLDVVDHVFGVDLDMGIEMGLEGGRDDGVHADVHGRIGRHFSFVVLQLECQGCQVSVVKIHQVSHEINQETPDIFRHKIGGGPPTFSPFIAFLLTTIFENFNFCFEKVSIKIIFAKIWVIQHQNKPENIRFWANFESNQKYTMTPD